MLNLNSIMVGTIKVKVMADFYEKVFGKPADMHEDTWYGWSVGSCFFNIGEHSEVTGPAKEPQRVILNMETKEVREEFERISKIEGIKIIKAPYYMSEEGEISSEVDGDGAWIATLADPDGNYFQLMTPWEGK